MFARPLSTTATSRTSRGTRPAVRTPTIILTRSAKASSPTTARCRFLRFTRWRQADDRHRPILPWRVRRAITRPVRPAAEDNSSPFYRPIRGGRRLRPQQGLHLHRIARSTLLRLHASVWPRQSLRGRADRRTDRGS
ncbi:unknown [Sinorhizobium phage PBC5]|nr:unknown [Sinorhizobium phage PBC5]